MEALSMTPKFIRIPEQPGSKNPMLVNINEISYVEFDNNWGPEFMNIHFKGDSGLEDSYVCAGDNIDSKGYDKMKKNLLDITA